MAAPQTPGFMGGGAGLVGVDQDPTNPNKYIARFANGNVIPLMGPTGKNLYDRQQAAKQLSAAPLPAERTGTTTVEAPQKIAGGLPPDAPPEQPQQQRATGPVSLGQTLEATDPATGKKFTGEAFKMPDGTVRVHRQGTPGSPGGLTSLGKQTMQEYAQAQIMSAQHAQKAEEYRQIGVDLAVQDAEARQSYIEEQKIQTQLEMQKQADEEAAIQKKVNALEAGYEKARAEFASARVDPTRIGKGGKNWLFGLSAALGALGASLARTPNFAMQFIEGRIADDIRSQEAEINVKGRDADNQLATLTRALGDLSLAKKSMRQLRLEEASLEGQRVANQFAGQQIANNARLVAEQSAAEGIKAGEERKRGFVEKVFKDNLYYRKGSAGSPGGFYLTGTNELQGRKNLEAAPATDAAGGSSRALPTERTTKISENANIIKLGLGLLSNPALEGDDSFFGPKGSALSKVPLTDGALAGEDHQRYAQDAQQWQNYRIKAMTGAGVGVEEAKRLAKAEVGEGSKNEIKHGVTQGVEAAVASIRTDMSALTPEQQQAVLATLPPEARDAILGIQK